MAEQLTVQQRTAVLNQGGELLVSAAAGSGKTKVLVDRLMRYLTDPVRPANLDDFLIITYTKAAAAELRGKIAAKLSERIAQEPDNRHLQQQMQRLYLAKISTVHSFCADILREHAYMLDIAVDFRVADENECLEFQARVMEKLLDDAYENIATDANFRALADTQGLGRDDRQIPEIIYKVYSSAKCHLDPERWLDWCASVCDVSQIEDAAETVWGKHLVNDLQNYLQLQIRALEKCIQLAKNTEGMEKPAILLSDTVEQLKLLFACSTWDSVCRHKSIDYGRLTFPKNCADPALAEKIKAVREGCKKGLAKKLRNFSDSSAQALSDIAATADAARGLICLVKRFSEAYDSVKRSRRVLDFGDLEHKTLDLLVGRSRSSPTRVATEIGQRFREIMVDEYQDSNVVQDTIFKALTAKKHNCFMVGDVKQSIYQFRLADPGIFLEKYKRFVPADDAVDGEGRKVLLSSNFRSAGSVISAVNDVFSLCMSPAVGGLYYGDSEALNEGIPHKPIDEQEVELYGIQVESDTYAEEAAFTAERIRELLDGSHFVREGDGLRPIVADDIVILLRSPGSVGADFKTALENVGIRCTTGGSADLLHTEEIEVLRALLQVICNPLQDIPLIAVLSSRVFRFTADDLAAVRAGRNFGSFYHAVKDAETEKTVAFIKVLDELRSEAGMYGVSRLLNRIFSLTRMDSIYASMPDGRDRVENLQSFCQIAAAFENNAFGSLSHFLEHLDAMEERGIAVTAQDTEAGAVTIMSIHKSKGLEFPVVFLCGLAREFNRESTRAQVLCHKELGMGLACVDTENRVRYPSIAKRAIAASMTMESISEEMRVLYVAMTRAKDRLIMTYAARNLESELSGIVNRMDICDTLLMTGDVDCPGKWVLYAALHRKEAGEFFALAGRPNAVHTGEDPWLIRVVHAPSVVSTIDAEEVAVVLDIPEDAITRLVKGLNFQYPYMEATYAPSKQTATQLKGRDKDREAQENTAEITYSKRTWRKPSFSDPDDGGTAYGNALHCVMQYIRYEACGSEAGVQDEVDRLVSEQYIAPQQGEMINTQQIAAFFRTQLGQKLQSGANVLREFKFSVLEDGEKYYPNMKGEKILLQGVIDCALIEPDGITVIDFKSDRVTDETIPDAVAHYRMQITAYADALSRIYELPVKSAQLYFFACNRFEVIL